MADDEDGLDAVGSPEERRIEVLLRRHQLGAAPEAVDGNDRLRPRGGDLPCQDLGVLLRRVLQGVRGREGCCTHDEDEGGADVGTAEGDDRQLDYCMYEGEHGVASGDALLAKHVGALLRNHRNGLQRELGVVVDVAVPVVPFPELGGYGSDGKATNQWNL
ncbi:hypothetical protein QR680_012512 [Steinernema hermaphroditum]|uniref:Uncharacterized protein n=1 Tax=Steinernema hermaphroditum TaxID=289476 RepID=A0AA39M0M5_9BILA|nr:hypothetical protein QR680_012512 [Steinernema hermaphroditum]